MAKSLKNIFKKIHKKREDKNQIDLKIYLYTHNGFTLQSCIQSKKKVIHIKRKQESDLQLTTQIIQLFGHTLPHGLQSK